jgi:hypothetical protein
MLTTSTPGYFLQWWENINKEGVKTGFYEFKPQAIDFVHRKYRKLLYSTLKMNRSNVEAFTSNAELNKPLARNTNDFFQTPPKLRGVSLPPTGGVLCASICTTFEDEFLMHLHHRILKNHHLS